MQVARAEVGRADAVRAAAAQLGFEDLGNPLIATTFVALDLETTGLSPHRDRITEIGAVKVRGGEVLGELRTFVHPERPIPPAVTALTGITDAMVRGAPTIGAVLPTLRDFLGDAVLVAHNAHFDVAFLRAALAARGEPFDPVVVDTARLARRLLRDEVRDVRLATLARHLRARTLPEHRALADARATVDVLHGLIERAGTLGATTLEDLRELARSTSDRAFRRIGLVRDAPRGPGTYRFVDGRGEVLYVGRATDLRSRLRTYFGQDRRRRIADLVRETSEVTWTPTATLIEAEVLELRAIHRHRPRFNRRDARPGSAVHLALTREPFPRLALVRRPGRGHHWTLGPLPSRRTAEQLVVALRDATGLRSCTLRLRRRQDHPACVLKDLGRCGAPCDGTQSPASYETLVEDVSRTLADPTGLLGTLRRRMHDLAVRGRFEEAGEVRARLHDTARALTAVRRRDALTSVSRLVVAGATDDGLEVVAIRGGGLVGTCRLPRDADDAAVAAAAAALDPEGAPRSDLDPEGAPRPDLDPERRPRPDAEGRGSDADGRRAGAGGPRPDTDGRRAGAGGPRPDTDGPDPEGGPAPEETALLLSWLQRPGVRVVEIDGVYAEPAAGGAALAGTLAEARRVDRQVRRDRQVLAGAKVLRRDRETVGRG